MYLHEHPCILSTTSILPKPFLSSPPQPFSPFHTRFYNLMPSSVFFIHACITYTGQILFFYSGLISIFLYPHAFPHPPGFPPLPPDFQVNFPLPILLYTPSHLKNPIFASIFPCPIHQYHLSTLPFPHILVFQRPHMFYHAASFL